ncbi:hypothetical protein EUA02_08780 [Mycobacterium paragordonae]|nr:MULTISPECIES: DegT/DnrJ/EryC1/StrS family aminotransferase [Mycobacterium]TDK98933.1 hypothetical protein EUA02_08780 [Mycobacterium paragordonae]TDL09256.1 hypothetical protein EUA05_09300 [Mycobacterium paragordonae]
MLERPSSRAPAHRSRTIPDTSDSLTRGPKERQGVLRNYRGGMTSAGRRFQSNADASAPSFASASCTSPEHKPAVLASLQRHAIQARDNYDPPQHRHPYFVTNAELLKSTALPVAEAICSRIVSLPVHDHTAPTNVARAVAAEQEAWR